MPFLEGTKFGARNKIIMVPKSSFWGKLKSFMYENPDILEVLERSTLICRPTTSEKSKYSFFSFMFFS